MELLWLLCVLNVVEKPYSYSLILFPFVVAVQLSVKEISHSWWISTYFPHHRVIRLKNQPLQRLLAKTSIFFIPLQIIDIQRNLLSIFLVNPFFQELIGNLTVKSTVEQQLMGFVNNSGLYQLINQPIKTREHCWSRFGHSR